MKAKEKKRKRKEKKEKAISGKCQQVECLLNIHT